MNINLDTLLEELKHDYHVQHSNRFNRQITSLQLVDEANLSSCTNPETLYLLRLRSLHSIPFCPANVPVLCVVSPNSATLPVAAEPGFGPRSGMMILVYAERLDDVLLRLTEITYRCGQRSSSLGEFSRELLKCKSMDELLQAGYRRLGNPLVVTDRWHRILWCTSPDTTDHPDYTELCSRESFLEQQPDLQGVLAALDESMRYTRPVRGHSICDFLCRSLCTGQNSDGTVYALAFTRPLTYEDDSVLELLGSFIHLFLKNTNPDKTVTARDALGTLLEQLVENPDISRDRMELQLEQLELQLNQYHYILSVQPTEQLPSLQTPIHNLLQILPGMFESALGTYYRNQLILMVDTNREIISFSEEWAEFSRYLRENCLRVGISNVCQDILNLKDYYFQSQRAVVLGGQLFPDRALIPYYLCAPYHVLELAATYEDPIHFCDPAVLRLYHADRQNNTDLLHTLEQYILSGRNKAQTAQRLFIHLNTVKYRLHQISEIIPLKDLTTADEVRLQLSLMALRYIKSRDGAETQ